ncbi:MAG TPA: hypothetical protein PK513_08170 [Alphaproteobacteria bacterium]|nr:hypothetical protein [Alphaproteobacteria bacterium]
MAEYFKKQQILAILEKNQRLSVAPSPSETATAPSDAEESSEASLNMAENAASPILT